MHALATRHRRLPTALRGRLLGVGVRILSAGRTGLAEGSRGEQVDMMPTALLASGVSPAATRRRRAGGQRGVPRRHFRRLSDAKLGAVVPRHCGWCTHPRRQELEHRINEGEAIAVVAAAAGYSESAAKRHISNHLRPEMQAELRHSASLHVADFTDRLVELSEESGRVRAYAKQVNDGRLLLSAIQTERETLAVLLNRLGIDSEATADTLREARALALSVGAVARTQSAEVASALAEECRRRGADDLADSFAQLVEDRSPRAALPGTTTIDQEQESA